jgi:molybdate/tungstate transport system substrate-binding protein
LAEKFYREKNLYQNCIDNRPEKNVKAKAVQLVKLIKSGDLDYGWEYISVASQKGLKYIKLDDHINLGNYTYDEFYRQAQVKVTGKKPGSWITKEGQSCTYGITMLKNAPNPEAAQAFLAYLLSPQNGLSVLKEMGQPVFIPCRVPSEKMATQIPEPVRAFVEAKN